MSAAMPGGDSQDPRGPQGLEQCWAHSVWFPNSSFFFFFSLSNGRELFSDDW